MELTASKPLDYLGYLQDELGIDPEELKSSPQVAANLKLGNSFNLLSYKILGYEYGKDGQPVAVRIKTISDPSYASQKQFSKQDGKYARLPNDTPDSQIMTIPIDQFNKLSTQGLDSAQAGGGAGMLPGGMQ